jgi:hypothetical protein
VHVELAKDAAMVDQALELVCVAIDPVDLEQRSRQAKHAVKHGLRAN